MRFKLALLLTAFVCGPFAAAQDGLIDSLDTASFKSAAGKGQVELVEGKVGKALQLAYPENSKSVFAARPAKATAAWDEAAGLSFWVKGDGKAGFGCLQLIWNEDYAVRYDCAFPVSGAEWQKVTLAWRDFVPVLPSPNSKRLDRAANPPSKISQLWFGKWWYWRDVGPLTFAIDELRLEPKIEFDMTDFTPAAGALARTAEKLKAGQPITIVTMGDSLTDTNHWTNRQTNWPAMLKESIQKRWGSKVTIVNPAIGGTQLRQNLVLMPLWLKETPEPDLVTICFGYNDWDAGMRGAMFEETHKDAVDRVRRATKGKADVLLMTPARALTRWDGMAELCEATRQAATSRKAGLVDLEVAFGLAGRDDRAKLFATDKVHLSQPGQEVVANAVLEALTAAAK